VINYRDILRLCVHAVYVVFLVVLIGWLIGLGKIVGPMGVGATIALFWVQWKTVRLLGRR